MLKEGDIVEMTKDSELESPMAKGSIGVVYIALESYCIVRFPSDDDAWTETVGSLRKLNVLFPKHYKGFKHYKTKD